MTNIEQECKEMTNDPYWTYYMSYCYSIIFSSPLAALAQTEEAGFTADRPGATTGDVMCCLKDDCSGKWEWAINKSDRMVPLHIFGR